MMFVELSGGAPAEVPGRWYWAVYTVPRQVGGMHGGLCADFFSLDPGLATASIPPKPEELQKFRLQSARV